MEMWNLFDVFEGNEPSPDLKFHNHGDYATMLDRRLNTISR